MYQRKVDVDMLNAVKSVLADVSSVSPSSEQRELMSQVWIQLKVDQKIAKDQTVLTVRTKTKDAYFG